MAERQPPVSNFYIACRNNDIDTVKSLLETMITDEINKLEPNGSTALHAASYYGHHEIVELLLMHGASRSIKNKYNYIPYDEGKTDTIKVLLSRDDNKDRFVGDSNNSIEWIRIGDKIDQEAKAIRKMLKAYSNQNKNKKKKNLINMIDLGSYKDIDKIKRYFDQANELNDPTYIIRAYTEETEFYQRLNRELARVHQLNLTDENQRQLLDFLHLICCHSDLRKYDFQDEIYRGMNMDVNDLKQYEIGAKIMTKTLLSTSKDRRIAEKFATKTGISTGGTTIKKACICKYKIRKAHTALAIQELSVYPQEQEVLIVPYSAFQVVQIQEIRSDYGVITEIELRQCKSHVETHTAIAVGGGLFAAAMGSVVGLFLDNEDDEN
ncbi:unnamed protein product [Rotaria sp. Silwood2]|nr:unnamed protein product [Rotaria sp. Silwood2]CAF2939083.1 unnamed protein product [Rotaria sp. Silwood2]CAF3351970.1 unnamed protein product [Rotaria sp. Silwood2]CAF4363885.1 unnamed protein product [Rotaria sp. Silwood2]CAF4508260.1 unnamed protein product [Rotaria sp. Silwood2]